MYSGTTFRRDSGRVIGAHQKIDRVARRKLQKLLPDNVDFPRIGQILHFEGKNGPDGLKLKNPSQDDYEHTINPANPDDRTMIIAINNHIINLAMALKANNQVRASFEAAWMAHAIADGLTPAHHHPADDSNKESWLVSSKKINALKTKYIENHNDKKRGAFLEKWGSWGNGGVYAHILFEWGIATTITPNNFKNSDPTSEDIVRLRKNGFEKLFIDYVQQVYAMDMYSAFLKKGWTRKLAQQTKNDLLPIIIKAVTLAWYEAVLIASEADKK